MRSATSPPSNRPPSWSSPRTSFCERRPSCVPEGRDGGKPREEPVALTCPRCRRCYFPLLRRPRQGGSIPPVGGRTSAAEEARPGEGRCDRRSLMAGTSHAAAMSRAAAASKARQFVRREPGQARVVRRERPDSPGRVNIEQVPCDGLLQRGLQDGEFAIDGGRCDDLPAGRLPGLDAEARAVGKAERPERGVELRQQIARRAVTVPRGPKP